MLPAPVFSTNGTSTGDRSITTYSCDTHLQAVKSRRCLSPPCSPAFPRGRSIADPRVFKVVARPLFATAYNAATCAYASAIRLLDHWIEQCSIGPWPWSPDPG